jgi:hypothetical protein
MGSFLDVTAPPILLLLVLAAVVFAAIRIIANQGLANRIKRQLYQAQRDQITSKPAKMALDTAQKVMIEIINDPLAQDELRSRAIEAYDQINQVLSQEK